MKRLLIVFALLQTSLAAETYTHVATVPSFFESLLGPVKLLSLHTHYELKIEDQSASLRRSFPNQGAAIQFEIEKREDVYILRLDEDHWANETQEIGMFTIYIESEDVLHWNGRVFKRGSSILKDEKD